MKKSYCVFIAIILLIAFGLGCWAVSLKKENSTLTQNNYNYSFTELVNSVNNIENYLAKSLISKSTKHLSETLSEIWNYSNLAIVYFENIPFIDEGTNKSIKFLNQVSDYSYTLSRKTIKGEELEDSDFDNLRTLYNYSSTLKDVLNELSTELNSGIISWDDLNSQTDWTFTDDDVNIFANIESNFDDYEGLIYDGAYSDYVINYEKLGVIGEEINEDDAKKRIEEIFEDDEIEEITSNGEVIGNDIECYSFTVKTNKNDDVCVYISKIGGWIVNILSDKDVTEEKISEEDAISVGKEYLDKIGYANMTQTYYIKKENVITINFAYQENNIIMYPDLIKVKVALDDGEILGLEATGYLNNHINRKNLIAEITTEQARSDLNEDLEILSEGLAVIPLNNNEEVFCYEFKGKIENKEFLVYINAVTGEEEEILVILETEGGVLTI